MSSAARTRRVLADRVLSSLPNFLRNLSFQHKTLAFIVGQPRARKGALLVVQLEDSVSNEERMMYQTLLSVSKGTIVVGSLWWHIFVPSVAGSIA